jgi:aspartate/methionine/tyrosine aminotransferase
MITEPHNPGGALSSREDVLALARLAGARGALLVVNEVYRGFGESESFHGLADNLVVVSSLSKLFGAYQARLGWISAGAGLIERLRWGHLSMGMASASGAMAGLWFLEDAGRRLDKARALAREGIDEMWSWIGENPRLSWHLPRGPGFACIRLPGDVDDMELGERLCNEHGVLLVPGTLFEAPGTVRISWLGAGQRLGEGLELVSRAI